MDPDFEEPLFSLDIVKEEILESEEGQMWLVAGRDEGWPVKEEVVDAPMVKEEVEDGETWGNGGCAKSGNPNFGENPESKRMRWTPRTEASAYVTPKEMTAEVKKESEPFPAVGGQAVPLGSTYDSLPYAKLESFNAHVLLSTEYANAVKKEEERQNSAEDRKNCPVDGRLENFLSHADLVDHMKKHPSPVICGLCKKSFPSPSNLRRHYVIHTREEKFACSCCGKRFIRLGDLRRHIQIHTGERPYECDVCEYKAAHPSNLKKHKLTHTRERPFPCSACDKRFRTSSFLAVHMRNHTGERPYECHVCGYSASHPSNLKNHMITPEPLGFFVQRFPH